jgi:beta-N-acetylhexosaminidase
VPAALAVALSLIVTALAACSASAQRTAGPARGAGPYSAAQENSTRASVASAVRRMSLEQKVGQLIVATVPGTAAPDGGASLVAKYHLGGVIYFAQNVQNAQQVAAFSNGLQRAAVAQPPGVPLTIGTDQEGGIVSRLDGVLTAFPGEMASGATRDPALVSAEAEATGSQLRAVGVNLDYAPVADVNVDPANPVIGVRSFGSDPALVSQLTSAALAGFHQAGIATAVKHFPGHGDTDTDSHSGLPVIHHSLQQWQQIDAPPFEAAVRGGTDMILSAHISVPALDSSGGPATLSSRIMTGLLRGTLGYNGVITTDSLQMTGVRLQYNNAQIAVHAIQAGCDELLMPDNVGTAYNAVLAAVRDGQIPQSRLDASVTRILTLKAVRGILDRPYVDAAAARTGAGTPSGAATAQRVADRSITLVRNTGHLLPLARGKRLYVAGPDAGSLTAALAHAGVETVSSPGTADAIVVTVNGATGDAGQQELVSGLLADRRPVIVVATGEPYDLGMFPGAGAALASYSDSGVSMNAVARSLTGALRPSGKLPVTVPGAGGRTAYPFGTGLGY